MRNFVDYYLMFNLVSSLSVNVLGRLTDSREDTAVPGGGGGGGNLHGHRCLTISAA